MDSLPAILGSLLLALPVLLVLRHRHRVASEDALFRTALPADQRAVLRARVPLSRNLSDARRARLEGLVQLFLASKTFIGCRGVEVNDVMRVSVAGHACLLLLGRDDTEVYPELSTIYLYPSTYMRRDEWALDGGMVVREEGAGFDGESWDHSSVVLSLRAIRESVAEFDGFNVVIHEFAHQYDAFEGESNGCPPMTRELHERWAPAMRQAWDALVEADAAGRETFLDPYGAESPAEFFAVLTESFFELPEALAQAHPDLFPLMVEAYGFDARELHRVDPSRLRPEPTPAGD